MYFKPEEFACQCGCGKGYEDMAEELLRALVRARSMSPVPFVLTSAYRCQSHNEAVGGAPSSSHMNGSAVDIRTKNSSDRYQILMAVIGAGFNRIGIAKNFIHVDVDDKKRGEVCWVYSQG